MAPLQLVFVLWLAAHDMMPRTATPARLLRAHAVPIPVPLCLQDMTTMSYLNEPSVLWNLKTRYQTDDIYTCVGQHLTGLAGSGPGARVESVDHP